MLGGQMPIFILKEGTSREQGRNAQRSNIEAAKAIADAVRTTLGPKGMDKMLVDSIGDIIISNDGATILKDQSIIVYGPVMGTFSFPLKFSSRKASSS